MAFVTLSSVYTADPSDIWSPKNSFLISDPFAIVMRIQVDQGTINNAPLFNVDAQIVNPRQDPGTDSWWTVFNGNIVSVPTIDVSWDEVSFQWGTNFAVFFTWNHFASAVSQVSGPTILGVYYVQGTINVQEANLFDHSGPFWFKTDIAL